MKGEIRRSGIISRLSSALSPISAGVLSEEFGVSRQIIVKDIARLRESGFTITAHIRGYVLENNPDYKRVFKIIHAEDEVERELNLIVDLGGVVEDVFIYHKVYNTVRADMNIRTRADVKQFLYNIATGKSRLLMNATSGYHYHTVSADSSDKLDIIEAELGKCGFLARLQEFEPDGIDIR